MHLYQRNYIVNNKFRDRKWRKSAHRTRHIMKQIVPAVWKGDLITHRDTYNERSWSVISFYIPFGVSRRKILIISPDRNRSKLTELFISNSVQTARIIISLSILHARRFLESARLPSCVKFKQTENTVFLDVWWRFDVSTNPSTKNPFQHFRYSLTISNQNSSSFISSGIFKNRSTFRNTLDLLINEILCLMISRCLIIWIDRFSI